MRLIAILVLSWCWSPAAHAQVVPTCSFDAGTATVTVAVNRGNAELVASQTSGKIRLNGVDCGAATVNNTDSVLLNGTANGVPDLVTLKGSFTPGLTPEGDGLSEIEISFALGGTCDVCGGQDTATVNLTNAADSVTFTSGGLDIGGDLDQDITVAGTQRVEIVGLGGNDVIDARAYTGGGLVALYGGNGNDKIHGTAADDELYGDAGNDAVYGVDGNDLIHGGLGNDSLFGGAGLDVFVSEDTIDGSDTMNGGPGADEVSYRFRPSPVSVTLDNTLADDGEAGEGDLVQASVENATGGIGDDVIIGNDKANVLVGNAGLDEIHGGGGNDSITGGGSADTLFGDDGDDEIHGEGGADFLTGGAGLDLLDAYAGNDTIFNADGEADVVECGPGTDDPEPDPLDTFTDCEL